VTIATGQPFGAVVRSEWTKLTALRSTRATMLAFPVAGVALAILIGARSGAHPPTSTSDPTNNLLAALIPGYLVIPVLGVLMMTSEYGSGLIRITLAAVPRRGWVLAAKAAVLAAVGLAGCEAVTFAAFLAGRAAMGTGAPHLTDSGVLRALLLSGAYLVLMGLFGLGLGAAIRRSGAAVAWYAGLAILGPTLLGVVSVRAAGYGPIIILANSVSAANVQPQFLSPWAGFGLMAAYAAVALTAGAVTLARRDA
jgi:ABC-2 type transport system permease protein